MVSVTAQAADATADAKTAATAAATTAATPAATTIAATTSGPATQVLATAATSPADAAPKIRTVQRDVEIGVDDGAHCEILSGLKEGDKVVIQSDAQGKWTKQVNDDFYY